MLLTSCVSTKKFTSFVEPRFIDAKVNTNSGNFVFDFTNFENTNTPVVSKKLKSQFIPAILYWEWNNTIKCEIDPKIVGQLFQENFLYFADTLKLQDKLQGRKLEIKLEKIPSNFVYTNKGSTIIFIFAYAISTLEAIFPQEQNLMISYKLTEDGKTIKEGKLDVANKDQPLKNVWKSTKKFTWLYIDQFKQNNQTMTKEIVENLLIEI